MCTMIGNREQKDGKEPTRHLVWSSFGVSRMVGRSVTMRIRAKICSTIICSLCALGLLSCSKERLLTTMIVKVPSSGSIATNVTIPTSDHVFFLIGYAGPAASLEGELTVAGEHVTNCFPITKDNEEANWLREFGLNAVLIGSKSITARSFPGGGYRQGEDCKIRLSLTNAPPSALYVCYLR